MAIQRITSGIIADGAIVATDIGDGVVTGPKLGANAINANNIVDGTITNAKIDTVANTKLTGTVTNAQVGESVYEGIGYRNRVINGDMRIDQRNAGAAVTSDNTYPVDRINMAFATDGGFSAQQDSSAPAGFTNSVKFTTTTADADLGTTQRALVMHNIEGTNLSDLGFGTEGAKTVTLSFWVRSSLTGTFGGSLANSAQNRSYPFTYTISVADTWEYKTITVAGDTTGTWLTTTGVGLRIRFSMGVGSSYLGTAGAWAGSDFRGATGETNVMATLNATWYVTGVQLEVGSVATPFERRPYGTELALCMRYYEKSYKIGTVPGTSTNDGAQAAAGSTEDSGGYYATIKFLVPKRTAPTMTGYAPDGTSGSWFRKSSGVAAGTSAVTFDLQSENSTRFYVTPPFSNWVVAYAAGHWVASAEL